MQDKIRILKSLNNFIQKTFATYMIAIDICGDEFIFYRDYEGNKRQIYNWNTNHFIMCWVENGCLEKISAEDRLNLFPFIFGSKSR